MRQVQGKVWGETWPLFARNNVELHRIRVSAGHECSKHRHAHKHNMFFCLSGLLDIYVWKRDYTLVDRTQLQPGECMTVAPGEFHQFRAVQDTDALEVYWVELSETDIERETVGK